MVDKYFHIKKIPTELTLPWIIKQLDKLEHFLKTEDNIINDHRDVYEPLFNDKYYVDSIYNTYDINKFEPEIVFCEDNIELNDLWLVYRLKVSSCKFSKQPGINIKILVRDKFTKKYIGIISLSSDILNLACRDKYIGWSYDDRKNGKLQNIINITTCVGIPPFSFNFNVGKLLTMLAFSKEIYQYINKKYDKKIAGIITLSLYGKSIQYDRLKELKLIGFTQGYGVMQIPNIIYDILLRYCKENNIDCLSSRKMFTLGNIITELKLPNSLIKHNIERGIYFGYTGKNAKEFLCGKTDVFQPDCIVSIKHIFKYWKQRWAVNRFENLLKIKNIMLTYESKNILTNKDVSRKKVKRFREKKKEIKKNELTNDETQEIINFYYNNKNITCNKISSIFTDKLNKIVDHKKIKRILFL